MLVVVYNLYQESLANAKISARQQRAGGALSEKIYSKSTLGLCDFKLMVNGNRGRITYRFAIYYRV